MPSEFCAIEAFPQIEPIVAGPILIDAVPRKSSPATSQGTAKSQVSEGTRLTLASPHSTAAAVSKTSEVVRTRSTTPELLFAAIDFETANNERNSACSVAVVLCKGFRTLEKISFLIRPPRNYFTNTHIHGIRWTDVKEAPAFPEVWMQVAPLLQSVNFIAAHNAAFDRSVLGATCTHYGLMAPASPWVCTYRQVAKNLWPHFANYKLSTICGKFGIPLQHHEAMSDANAVAQIMFRAMRDGWYL